MALSSMDGPLVVYGQSPVPAGSQRGIAQDYNGQRGPSFFDQGVALMDPRYPFAYQPGELGGATGWFGTSLVHALDVVPSTASLVSIAGAQVPVAGTPLTLVAATALGVTVGQSITRSDTGALVKNLLAIDGQSAQIAFGTNGNFVWDPTKIAGRCLSLQSAGDDHLATATIRGYDVYWFPMTETVTLGNIATVVSKKAFKYVQSITPAGTLSGANLNVGQSDTIGLPLRADRFQQVQIYWPDTTLVSATTGYTAAVTTSPATAITGDVRGTYAVQSASDGTKRLIVRSVPAVSNITSGAGLAGVTQFADF
jgi:hypothetical protein